MGGQRYAPASLVRETKPVPVVQEAVYRASAGMDTWGKSYLNRDSIPWPSSP
jgi:hypothetical protein